MCEEYGVKVVEYTKLGTFPNIEEDGVLNVRHLYFITKWKGKLLNLEEVNDHVEATIEEAFNICKHPLSQIFLRRIQLELSR